MKNDELIADGIYPGIPAPEYFTALRWGKRMSPSILEYGVEGTMCHVKAAWDGELKFDSEPLSFGRAYHARLLEPERFKTDFAIAQQCDALTRDGKGPRCSKMGRVYIGEEWLCATHGGDHSEVEVIDAEEAAIIEKMRAQVFAHNAINILRQKGTTEVCIAWTCPRTGIKCKSRLDKLIVDCDFGDTVDVIVDLKSVRCANEKEISKAIEEYGWARAGAMRCDGYEVLTGKRPVYVLVCQEKTAPYAVAVKSLSPATMEGATREYRGLMATWANCVKTGHYPGYSDDIDEIDVPLFKLKEYQNVAKHSLVEVNV